MTPNRTPLLFLGGLSNIPITPTNPHGLNAHWQTPDPGWLYDLIHVHDVNRVMISDPAGWTNPPDWAGPGDQGQVRWPHWDTLNDGQRAEMAAASTQWRAQHPAGELALYVGRKIAPPDDLDWDAHVLPIPNWTQQAWVNASIQPYVDLGYSLIGIDAASGLTPAQWSDLGRMIRTAAGKPIRVAAEAIQRLPGGAPNQAFARRYPQLCIWNYLTKPANNPRWLDPVWTFDPATTEVHCCLTSAESQVPGRVAALAAKGFVVSCRNQWWL